MWNPYPITFARFAWQNRQSCWLLLCWNIIFKHYVVIYNSERKSMFISFWYSIIKCKVLRQFLNYLHNFWKKNNVCHLSLTAFPLWYTGNKYCHGSYINSVVFHNKHDSLLGANIFIYGYFIHTEKWWFYRLILPIIIKVVEIFVLSLHL